MKNIFFDFDGTLVNTNKRQYLCFVTTVQKMKLTTNISFQKYLDLKETHLSNAGIYQLLFPEHNNLNLFLKIFIKNIENISLLAKDEVQKNSKDYLNEVKNIDLYLVTNRQNKNKLVMQLHYLGLNKYFKKIILSRNYSSKKEALLSNKINIYPKDLFISDDISDFNDLNLTKILINPKTYFDSKVIIFDDFLSLLKYQKINLAGKVYI